MNKILITIMLLSFIPGIKGAVSLDDVDRGYAVKRILLEMTGRYPEAQLADVYKSFFSGQVRSRSFGGRFSLGKSIYFRGNISDR